MSNSNFTLPKTTTGRVVLVLAVIILLVFAIGGLFATQIFQFGMEGLGSSFEKQTNEQLINLQTAVDAQCGVGVAIVSKEGFWSETPRRPEYGWSNNQVSCHGDDNLQSNKIQCICSK
ncbi:MAG: hypothetical protein H0X30_17410 [Anaerolineae bacterium]|nr:hypothetical protein [Anaerolineae bacterium]